MASINVDPYRRRAYSNKRARAPSAWVIFANESRDQITTTIRVVPGKTTFRETLTILTERYPIIARLGPDIDMPTFYYKDTPDRQVVEPGDTFGHGTTYVVYESDQILARL